MVDFVSDTEGNDGTPTGNKVEKGGRSNDGR